MSRGLRLLTNHGRERVRLIFWRARTGASTLTHNQYS